jgi:hypothetical protein
MVIQRFPATIQLGVARVLGVVMKKFFEPSRSRRANVWLDEAPPAGFTATSLALQSEEVKVGLLDEYAEAVMDGVTNVAESIGAPTKASIRFRWAAHGLVGS